jgi:hypothetical protein
VLPSCAAVTVLIVPVKGAATVVDGAARVVVVVVAGVVVVVLGATVVAVVVRDLDAACGALDE